MGRRKLVEQHSLRIYFDTLWRVDILVLLMQQTAV